MCRTFKKALKYGVDITACGSESAVIMRLNGKSIIFYDDTKPTPHINFSIIHEWGHDVLGHDFSKKDMESYQIYEIETNYFAAQLLMPEQLLRDLQRRGERITCNFLQRNFGVSRQAAEKRIETLSKTNSDWYSKAEKQYDDIILMKYADFLNKIHPIKNEYDFEYEYERQRERDSWYM